jgi:osmotically-inducible protein OsmY
MHFLRFSAAALLTCGLAATYTFAADENKTENKSVVADVQAKDQTITRQIRKAIAEDVSLARSGNNVGVTTTGGAVLLRGTVTSEFAKAEIEKHAVIAAGALDKVTSELKVVESK